MLDYFHIIFTKFPSFQTKEKEYFKAGLELQTSVLLTTPCVKEFTLGPQEALTVLHKKKTWCITEAVVTFGTFIDLFLRCRLEWNPF